MEIPIEQNGHLIIAGIITIFATIVIYTEASAKVALLFMLSIALIVIAIIKLQQNGTLDSTRVYMTKYRNWTMKRRIKNPKMKQYTPEEVKEIKERNRGKKWNIHW